MAFLWFLAAQAMPVAAAPSAYRCLDGTTFTLLVSREQAIVRFRDGEYRMPRRSSAIAIKYQSKTATLYLDGDFAAFVADDRRLPGCVRVKA